MPVRPLALAAFVLALAASPHAQTRGSLHAALLHSGPSGGTPGSFEPVFGLGLGGGVEHALALPGPVLPRLSLDVALAATGRSDIQVFTDEEGVPVSEFEVATRTLYLTASPTVALQLARGPVRPYVTLGPAVAVKLAERLSWPDGVAARTRTSDAYPDLTSGAVAGVGVHVPGAFLLGALRIELRATRLAGRTDAAPEFRDLTDQHTIELRLGVAL